MHTSLDNSGMAVVILSMPLWDLSNTFMNIKKNHINTLSQIFRGQLLFTNVKGKWEYPLRLFLGGNETEIIGYKGESALGGGHTTKRQMYRFKKIGQYC